MFTDYKKLLALKEIKAISIATPNFLHHEITSVPLAVKALRLAQKV